MARRARYERELAWAPAHVADDLRTTALARRDHATQATLIRAHARTGNAQVRAERLARARAHQQLAHSLELREALLADIDSQRARWHDATEQARATAREATEELRRRFPTTDLDPFHRDVRERARAPEPAQPGTPQRTASTARPELSSAELRSAAELAEAARRTLDERKAHAQRDAELERRRQAEEPAPDRWPHRDPGYEFAAMQRRQAERTAPQLAAQDFRAAVLDLADARRWAEPDLEHTARQSRQAERDEPEAAL